METILSQSDRSESAVAPDYQPGIDPTMRVFRKPIRFVAAIVLVVTILAGALIVHSISADVYYNLNFLKLQTAADMAVRAGAEYLPRNTRAAAQVAATYAKYNGVASNEIELVEIDSAKRILSIRLRRKIPIYISLFAVGLPHGKIAVTASAQKRSLRSQASLHETSWDIGSGHRAAALCANVQVLDFVCLVARPRIGLARSEANQQ
jgi:hypothetical protein